MLLSLFLFSVSQQMIHVNKLGVVKTRQVEARFNAFIHVEMSSRDSVMLENTSPSKLILIFLTNQI